MSNMVWRYFGVQKWFGCDSIGGQKLVESFWSDLYNRYLWPASYFKSEVVARIISWAEDHCSTLYPWSYKPSHFNCYMGLTSANEKLNSTERTCIFWLTLFQVHRPAPAYQISMITFTLQPLSPHNHKISIKTDWALCWLKWINAHLIRHNPHAL